MMLQATATSSIEAPSRAKITVAGADARSVPVTPAAL